MIDPTTSTLTAWAATLSGVTLAVLGVDYYSLLYGLVGAMMAMHTAQVMTRLRAVLFVCLSTVVGAALGNGALAVAGSNNRALLIVGCIVCGASAQLLVSRLIAAAVARIDAMGGGATKPPPGADEPGGKP
jgi:surface polysaccharide O-acyltransferase-like enzyme